MNKFILTFLADVNIEKLIIDELRNMGYDIKWIAEENCRLEDTEIVEIACKENRILLTNDKDFGEIVFRQKLVSSGIILFRIKGQNVTKKLKLLKKLLTFYKNKIEKHFIVITINKFRFIYIGDVKN